MEKGRLFRIICGIMIAVIVVILVEMFVSDDDTMKNANLDMTKPYADTSCWMANLSDDEYLSELTIPGTHNSCARNVMLGFVMRCQETSISEQLANGYRYLDLRVALDPGSEGNTVKLVHNFANCHESGNLFSSYIHLQDVTDDLYKFLQDNPTETVIVNIKIEDDNHTVSDIQKVINEEIRANRDFWYTDEEIPTLGEVRGKIVLATRYEDALDSALTGLKLTWDEQDNTKPVDLPYELYVNDTLRLWVQDRYKYSAENKYEAIIDGLENCEADENTFFLNFVSTSGDGLIGHPRGYAKTLNDLLMEYDFKDDTSYGIIIVDFGDANLARKIYYSNSF